MTVYISPVIGSLRSNPVSDWCTWIASQARNDVGTTSFAYVWFFHRGLTM